MIHNQLKTNQQITAPEVRVLSETGENLGVLNREAALKLAQEKGLDLIEISASAKPPVARIMSFDKYRYEEEKKRKKKQAGQKNLEPKQIQTSVRAAKNDLELKAKKAVEFLSEGRPVTIVMVLRGREKANRNWAMFKLDEFMKLIAADYQVIAGPRFGGRGIMVQIIKK